MPGCCAPSRATSLWAPRSCEQCARRPGRDGTVRRVTHITAVATALPEHRYTQADITEALLPVIAEDRGSVGVLRRVHESSAVQTRHLAVPLETAVHPLAFGAANDLFVQQGSVLAQRAVLDALVRARLAASDVDFVVFTTVTGVSAPSLDAGLVASCGLRDDVKRMPSFGWGCAGGAAGLARVHDYLVGHPGEVGLLVSVELCSLTLQRGDHSVANAVASGLFGDGAAAVVLVGDEHPSRGRGAILPEPGARRALPRILDSRSRLVPGTSDVLGWDVGTSGFRIVLGAEVPAVVERHVASGIEDLLDAHGLGVGDVVVWIAHPGGPKVLDAMTRALRLGPDALRSSWDSLARVGNLSSASVLHILADVAEDPPPPGSFGVLFAVGPGIGAESVLLRWDAE